MRIAGIIFHPANACKSSIKAYRLWHTSTDDPSQSRIGISSQRTSSWNIAIPTVTPTTSGSSCRISVFPRPAPFKTFCGSDTYLAPEVDSSLRRNYTEAVDIWSLGVVMLRFAYALPRPGRGIGMRWCKKIVEKAHDKDSDGLIDILQRMLVIEPRARPSAADCLHEASRLLALFQDRSATPTPASYAAEYGAAMAHQEEQETLRISPYEVCSRKQSFH